MSYDPCKYCGQIAFKTNGNAELICYNRANTGDCDKTPIPEQGDWNYTPPAQQKKPENMICKCGLGNKIKNCKCKK